MGNKKETKSFNSGPLKASSKLHEMMKKKITTAVEFASKASIYRADITATELTTAQSILLSLMHSFLTNDLGFSVSLIELATNIDHLRSSYLPTWLRDDFNFDDQQVLKTLSRIAFLSQSGFLIIPTHILKVFVNLSPKYRVAECCRASGNTETFNFLSEFNLQEYSFNSKSSTSSFSPNSIQSNRSSGIDIISSNSNIRTMEDLFYVNGPQMLTNHPVQRPMGQEVARQESLRDLSAQTVPNFLDDEEPLVERTENPPLTLQEVWIENSSTEVTQPTNDALLENSAAALAQYPSPNEASSNELCMFTVREYLKVPEDFNEEELMSLITYSDTDGRTLLHRAVKDGNPYVVECMLRLGAKVNEKDTFGSTPSHCAASIGSISMLQVLAQNMADFTLTRNDGCTPLHEAIINGHEATCKWLLDHGSEMNVRNLDGWTPLHLAAQWNKCEIVKLLLENGADSKIYNNNGNTPVDIAREEGHTSIVELLSV